MEKQRTTTGKVRIIVLKSRQVGISTYFTGRSYYKTTFNPGVKAFVLTHEDDATVALFTMVKRFHDHTPEFIRPQVGASNAKELIFNRLDSGYLVATAGNKGTGRGQTIQIFHGSEVSRWPNAQEHVGGAMRAVPDLPGTEVYLESTANGVGNYFHQLWLAAVKGDSEFTAIFVPWFFHEEYEAEPEADWKAPPKINEYGALHKLNRRQLFWAYKTNREMAVATGSPINEICWLFRQEFPSTAEEAFTTATQSSYIQGRLVQAARQRHVIGTGPIILGVDIARGGKDKTAIIDRQGRRMGAHVYKKFDYGKDTMPIVGEIVTIVREMRQAFMPVAKVIIDSTGVGGPVYDRLRELLGEKMVAGIEFGGSPNDKDRFANKRAEMWHDMMQWFQDAAGCQVVDNEELQNDICAPAWRDPAKKGQQSMTRYRSDGCLIMEDKDSIKARLGNSPDFGDAAALTFALPFDELIPREQAPRQTKDYGPGAWML